MTTATEQQAAALGLEPDPETFLLRTTGFPATERDQDDDVELQAAERSLDEYMNFIENGGLDEQARKMVRQ
jgi:hypothetical protein